MLSFACAATGVTISKSLSKVEVSSGDLRAQNSLKMLDNVKVGFGGTVSLGPLKNRWSAKYELKGNRNFLKDASLAGDVAYMGVNLIYEATQSFKSRGLADRNVNLKLGTAAAGAKVLAEYSTSSPDSIKALSLGRSFDVGACTLSGMVEYQGAAKAVKYAMQANLRVMQQYLSSVKATVTRKMAAGADVNYEMELAQKLSPGRGISATLKNSKVLALEYLDAALDPAAEWTLTATMLLDDGVREAVANPAITLKRAWVF